MKIIHITESYIEGWGYQENLLPLYQKRAGYDVVVVSNNNHLGDVYNRPDIIQSIKARGKEYWDEGIKVYKIETKLNISSNISLVCKGLRAILYKEKPNIIFHHNVGVVTLAIAAAYKKRHPEIKLYVDNHADWINESKNKLWHLLYLGFIAPLIVKLIGKKVDFYIGVSPLRCQYLNQVYKVPHNKIRFLPIGCDTAQADQVKENREELRRKFGIPIDGFVVASGGRVNRNKGILELITACNTLRRQGERIYLVLFGKIEDDVASMAKLEWIKCWGWCDRITTLSLLKLADTACWPWLHTTLIEDSISVGTPLVVKMSDNVIHLANDKAGVFMKNGDVEELEESLMDIKKHADLYRENVMKAREKYSYASIVKQLEIESFYEWGI